jgi:hypothetical protein
MTGLDRRSDISDLRDFPFHRAAEGTELGAKRGIRTAGERRLTHKYSAYFFVRVSLAADLSRTWDRDFPNRGK